MKLLVLNHKEVEELLTMNECISVMETAFVSLAREEFYQPLRTIIKPDGAGGVMALMPTFRFGTSPLFGLKAICVFPGNAALGKDAHQGGVMLFDGQNGELLAVINASAITAIRTAAVSAVATRWLANPDAKNLAIIGAGVQARTHLEAMACVRSLERVRVAAGHVESAQKFVAEMQPRSSTELEVVATPAEAVDGADIIVTATTAREPVVQKAWISPGAHINAVGTFSPRAREIDTATMSAATIFVDRRESALNEAGDYLIAAQEGAIGPDHIRAELGEVLTGEHQGRSSTEEITLFKSLGLAIEDLAAAAYTFQKAQQQNAGSWIAF